MSRTKQYLQPPFPFLVHVPTPLNSFVNCSQGLPVLEVILPLLFHAYWPSMLLMFGPPVVRFHLLVQNIDLRNLKRKHGV